jgi:hypothetical protein
MDEFNRGVLHGILLVLFVQTMLWVFWKVLSTESGALKCESKIDNNCDT